MTPNSVLLFVHPPFYDVDGVIYFDAQAQNGLRLWAENFDVVRVIAPLDTVPEGAPPDAKPLQPFLDDHPTVEPIMLPRRGTLRFLTRDLAPGRAIIREKIAQSQYLVFGFSGYVGDWGTVACRAAARMNRKYAIFKDGVAHRVARVTQAREDRSLLKKLRHSIDNAYMKHSDRKVVSRAHLSLLHGQETFEYYSQFSKNPRLVHNIHISKSDRISLEALEQRLADRDAGTLRIAYSGRVEAIKGPECWLQALDQARRDGTHFSATWYGTGSLLDTQKQLLEELELQECAEFAGFMEQREMLARIRQADMFLFAHMTDESPRCLIEALSMGLPLVGFDSAYPRDLVGDTEAGLFVPRGDAAALSVAITDIANDPERLKRMSVAARKVAENLNDEDVFRARSEIVKSML